MSAIGQGDGQGDGQQGEAQGEAQGENTTITPEQFGQLTSGMEDLRQSMQAWQQQQAEQQPNGDGSEDSTLDLSWVDQPAYDEQAAQQANQRFSEQLQGLVQQQVAPLMKEIQDLKYETQADYLTREFPELEEEEAAKAIVSKAQQLAQHLGQPELGNNPDFWRVVHMADKAAEYANSLNGSENPNTAPLESAGGPGPAQVTEADIVKGIVESGGRGSKVLDFRMGS